MSAYSYEHERGLSVLTQWYGSARQGQGQVVLISGAGGSGKTTLLARFTDRAAADDALLLDATGSATESGWTFGLVRKLLESAPPSAGWAARALGLLDEAPATTTEQQLALLPGLTGTVLEAARGRPVVVAVDDVHFGDGASLQFLLHLARRARRARVLMVLTQPGRPHHDQLGLRAELGRQPHCHQLRLAPLSEEAVQRLLTERLGAPPTAQLAAETHAATGGNPLLLRALLEDQTDGIPPAGTPLRRGESYAHAVQESLHRMGPTAPVIARGLAALGESATPSLLARLLGLSVTVVEQGLRDLDRGGLLTQGTFRDPAAVSAVLHAAPGPLLAELHGRAAELLHQDGAIAIEVARHLLNSRTISAPWALQALQEAADYALAMDDAEFARRCLARAADACEDPRTNARLRTRLMNLLWQNDPTTAEGQLSALLPRLAAGGLPPDDLVLCMTYLAWAKRQDQAMDLLDSLERSGAADQPRTRAAITACHRWMGMVNPGLRRRPMPQPVAAPADEPLGGTLDVAHLHAASAVLTALSGPGAEEAARQAVRLLQRYCLGDGYLQPLVYALWSLVYAGRTDVAQHWCERLLGECTGHSAPAWQAALTAVRGEIALRQGDLPGAQRYIESALALLPLAGWGLTAYYPLATLIQAYTGRGRYEDAMRLLQHSGSQAHLQTLPGLHFRRARGQWFMATGRLHAALEEFLACGESMGRWDMDVPELVPWRLEAANAWLALGNQAKAAQLVEEQLRISPHRARAGTLRLLGSVREGRARIEPLQQAIALLEDGGDRIQLALALGELGRAHQELGDIHEARSLARRAWHMARICEAEPLCRQLMPGHMDSEPEAAATEAVMPKAAEELTEAESRVAMLAAHGHTNRQIAARLYVTVSTVEQHLTRIYRKLNVQRRRDLAKSLAARPGRNGYREGRPTAGVGGG
ncbi:AAA family ATPase [Streptomyces orinoci]|uniref:AAA family ATPase n=1 Tax=Streptomyces orinoci TaxID=67339 RepID=A0ABV3K3A4_STRON|nr:LuxR family transcriptional regulator [Streptomyces orinoci]